MHANMSEHGTLERGELKEGDTWVVKTVDWQEVNVGITGQKRKNVRLCFFQVDPNDTGTGKFVLCPLVWELVLYTSSKRCVFGQKFTLGLVIFLLSYNWLDWSGTMDTCKTYEDRQRVIIIGKEVVQLLCTEESATNDGDTVTTNSQRPTGPKRTSQMFCRGLDQPLHVWLSQLGAEPMPPLQRALGTTIMDTDLPVKDPHLQGRKSTRFRIICSKTPSLQDKWPWDFVETLTGVFVVAAAVSPENKCGINVLLSGTEVSCLPISSGI